MLSKDKDTTIQVLDAEGNALLFSFLKVHDKDNELYVYFVEKPVTSFVQRFVSAIRYLFNKRELKQMSLDTKMSNRLAIWILQNIQEERFNIWDWVATTPENRVYH